MRSFLFAALSLFALPALAEVGFGATQYQVREGDGELVIPVLLSNQDSAGVKVTVNYRTNPGTAVPPGDYTTTTGTLVWDVGDSAAKEIKIPINEDPSVEGAEDFTVTLFDASGAILSASPTAIINLFDNDGVGPGEFQFSITDLLVFEGVGTATLQVRRLNGTDGPVSVEITRVAGGTASPGADFTDAATVLTWADGDDSEKAFDITIVDDAFVETTETIKYALQNPTGGATITRGEALISIGDNDLDGTGSISFVQPTARVIENQPVVQLTVGRFGGSAGFAAVDYITRSGTADNGDYGAVAGTLTWDDGDLSTRTISVSIKDNLIVEPDEQFFVDLTPALGTTLGANKTTSVTIVDDDVASTTSVISIDQTNYSVQDDQGSIAITLNRTNPTGTASVQFTTTDANARAGEDYVTVSRIVNFGDGQATATVSIAILGPAGVNPEGPESFVASISSPSNASISGNDTATITITPSSTSTGASVIDFIEQDGASSSFCTGGTSVPTVIVSSNEKGALLTFQRGPGAPVAVTVQYRALTPCGAEKDTDFVLEDGTLSWGATDFSSRSVAISVKRETTDLDPTEEFLLELTNPVGATLETSLIRVVIQPGPGSGTPGQVNWVGTSVKIEDSAGPVQVRLRRAGGDGPLEVSYQTVDGNAVAGVNYSATSGVARWAAGDFSDKIISIPLRVSAEATPDVRFSVLAAVTSGNSEFAGGGTVEVTISSSVADDSKGVGGCSLGQADWVTHVFMLLLSVLMLNRARISRLLRGSKGAR